MKINTTNNTAFTGYSNVMLGKLNNNHQRLTYISAKLNNNGEKDLDKIFQIRENYPFLKKKKNNDIVTFVCLEDGIHRPSFSIDGFRIFDSEFLKEGLAEGFLQPNAEKYSTQLFTYLGNLTERLSYDGLVTKDSPTPELLFESLETFEKHLSDATKEETLASFLESFDGNINSRKIARIMHKGINEAFGDYYA